MEFFLRPILFCLTPDELLLELNSKDRCFYMDCMVTYVSKSLEQTPMHIKFVEILFRLLFYPIFALISHLPLESKRKYELSCLIFTALPQLDNFMRLYQSLALFALFENEYFYAQFGLITYKERQKKYKKIRRDLET